jgi:hypothetical protein
VISTIAPIIKAPATATTTATTMNTNTNANPAPSASTTAGATPAPASATTDPTPIATTATTSASVNYLDVAAWSIKIVGQVTTSATQSISPEEAETIRQTFKTADGLKRLAFLIQKHDEGTHLNEAQADYISLQKLLEAKYAHKVDVPRLIFNAKAKAATQANPYATTDTTTDTTDTTTDTAADTTAPPSTDAAGDNPTPATVTATNPTPSTTAAAADIPLVSATTTTDPTPVTAPDTPLANTLNKRGKKKQPTKQGNEPAPSGRETRARAQKRKAEEETPEDGNIVAARGAPTKRRR